MIKSTRIKNFQSHKDTDLNWHPYFNAIIGVSDCGKSSIAKAMLWAITGKPVGNSFVSKSGGNVSVGIEIEDATVIRSKGKKNEFYAVTNDGKSTTIPQEIESMLNINNINIDSQFDQHFLLNSSPGEVGRVINKAVKIDIIDKSLKNIASMSKKEINDLKSVKQNLNEKKEELKKYDWIETAEDEVSKLETTDRRITSLKPLLVGLRGVVNNLDTMEGLLRNSSNIAKYEKEIEKTETLFTSIQKINKERNGINLSIHGLNKIEKSLSNKDSVIKNEKSIEKTKKLVTTIQKNKSDGRILFTLVQRVKQREKELQELQKNINAIDIIEKMLGLYKDVDALSLGYNSLYDVVHDIDNINKNTTDKNEKLSELEKTFKDEMGDLCLLCGCEL